MDLVFFLILAFGQQNEDHDPLQKAHEEMHRHGLLHAKLGF